MSRKTEWILKGLFLAFGIASLLLPILVVKIGGKTFTETQTRFFLSASLLSFVAVCVTQILAAYARKEKINLFCLVASIALAAVLIGIWL